MDGDGKGDLCDDDADGDRILNFRVRNNSKGQIFRKTIFTENKQ